MIREVLGVEVGSKNPSKNDQKMKSTWEGILASIFDGFWWILGGKLGVKSSQDRPKIDSKRHQKNDEKKSASWSPQGGVRPRTGNGAAVPRPPPLLAIFKEQPRTQCTEHRTQPNSIIARRRASAVADLQLRYKLRFCGDDFLCL